MEVLRTWQRTSIWHFTGCEKIFRERAKRRMTSQSSGRWMVMSQLVDVSVAETGRKQT